MHSPYNFLGNGRTGTHIVGREYFDSPLRARKHTKKVFVLAPFLVSSSQETFVEDGRWFRGGGYRRIIPVPNGRN